MFLVQLRWKNDVSFALYTTKQFLMASGASQLTMFTIHKHGRPSYIHPAALVGFWQLLQHRTQLAPLEGSQNNYRDTTLFLYTTRKCTRLRRLNSLIFLNQKVWQAESLLCVIKDNVEWILPGSDSNFSLVGIFHFLGAPAPWGSIYLSTYPISILLPARH